jgi:hypothetical protein
MRKTTATIVILLAMLVAQAQDNILLKGFVFDADTKEPLALSALQIKNSQLGALTEDNGYFELPMPKSNLKDSLKASFVGYLPTVISIADYKTTDTLRIYIGTQIETKGEAVVIAMSAKGIMLKAIENMRKNFYFDSLIATGLYRQYHKENGKFVRLIEADESVAFNIKSPYKYSFHELIKTNHVRRSENYETNGDVHGDHLVDLLKENPYSYNRSNFLDPKKIGFYSPKFSGEDTETEYVISLQYKESSSATLEQAKIWVDKESYAITRMEIEKFPNPYYVKTRYANDSRWKLVNEKDVVETKKFNGKYVLSSIVRTYNHHVLNRQTGNVDYVVEEDFALYFDDYETDNVGAQLKGFESMSELYVTHYKYDSKFWDNYGPLDDHPLPDDIKKDLEHAVPLNKQFVDAGNGN